VVPPHGSTQGGLNSNRRQLVVVVFIYLISRKFHASFGIAGTEVTGKTPMEIAMKQGRGWEW
jgi:hypothetical protein